jgi:hypothetical protein
LQILQGLKAILMKNRYLPPNNRLVENFDQKIKKIMISEKNDTEKPQKS